MIINFENIAETRLEKFNGGEKAMLAKMFIDEHNKILMGKLEPGASIGMHVHETGSEIILIMKGEGTVLYDKETEKVSAGTCHYCPKGHAHSLINDSNADLEFFAVVPQQ